MAVFLAARLMARYADAYDPDLAAAFQKLGEALPPVLARHVQRTLDVMAARPLDPVGSRNLHLLTQAWAERRVVELTYDPSTYDPSRQPREARVRPYLIEPSADSHALYLIGFDETKGGLRTFKLERIRSLAISPVAFEPPPDGEIEAALDRAWGIVADQPVVEVVLRFAPSVASRVAETTWHPTQAAVRNADGSLTWRARVSGTFEIRPWILGWGADVEVLEPEALRAEIGGIVHAAAARYPRG
jgi:predicted DNA-binding transcriptional regulator YafY